MKERMPTVNKIQRHWVKKAESQYEKKPDPFYKNPLWKKLRSFLIAQNPLCYYCEMSNKKTFATLLDHFRPRRIYPEFELDADNLKSSCDHCHNIKRALEKGVTTREQFERKIPEILSKFRGVIYADKRYSNSANIKTSSRKR